MGQIGDVLWDPPILLPAPLYRRWHLHWGATPVEFDASLLGYGGWTGPGFATLFGVGRTAREAVTNMTAFLAQAHEPRQAALVSRRWWRAPRV